MNTSKYIAIFTCSFLVFFSSLSATVSASTTPVGFDKLTINGSQDGSTPAFTGISVNFENSVVLNGSIDEVPSPNIVADFSVSNDVDAFSATDNSGNNSYYFQITSGINEGLILDITSNTESTYSLNVDVSGLVNVGDKYSIKKHINLADVFGENNSVGFKSGGSAGVSDKVYVMSTDGSATYAVYYYQTDELGFLGGDGWRLAGDSSTDMSNVIIEPDDGLFVGRIGTGDLNLTISGAVNTVNHQRFLPTGYSLISYPFPVDVKLADLGLYSESNGYVSGGSAGSSDRIYIISADGTFEVYYRQTDALGFLGGDGWRLLGDRNTSYDEKIIPAGSSFIVYHIGTGLDWSDPVPYTF